MLAAYFVAGGLGATQALSKVRALRPGSVETVLQEETVADYDITLRTSEEEH